MVWQAVSPEGRERIIKYDDQGRVTEVAIPDVASWEYGYDDDGRLETLTQGGRVTTWTYQPDGDLDYVEDPLFRRTTYVHDEAGRLESVILPGGHTVGFGQDANGNLTGVTPPAREEHAHDRTANGLLDRYEPPPVEDPVTGTPLEIGWEDYSYNDDQQWESSDRSDFQSINPVYDSMSGRLTSLDYFEESLTPEYDSADGSLVALGRSDGASLALTWDGPLLVLEAWNGPHSSFVERDYDSNFRLSGEAVQDGSWYQYFYDDDGLLTQAGPITLTRDADNGRLTATSLGVVTESYGINGYGEPDEYQAKVNVNGNVTPLWTVGTERDSLGRVDLRTETFNGTTVETDFDYDEAGRLYQVRKDGVLQDEYEYHYDGNGNRFYPGMLSADVDAQDRLQSWGSNAYTWTDHGSLASKNGTSYDYDIFGQLREVVLDDGTEITYGVDALHRRVTRSVDGGVTHRYVYNGRRLVGEVDASGIETSRYLYGTNAHSPDVMIKNGTTYRLLTDTLGSVRWVVKASDGQVVQQMEYDPWGRVLVDTAIGFQPFGFAGGLYDQSTGLVRFGARDYDAETGRWTAKDPIRFAGGDGNLYGYVWNDPQNFIDPEGLDGRAAAGSALSSVGSTGWSYFSFNSEARGRGQWLKWGFGSWKCNFFVFEMLAAGGDPAGRMVDGRVPSASEWADPNTNIPGYYVLPEGTPIRRGDVLAGGGHVGIYYPLEGEDATISANETDVGHSSWPFDTQSKPTVRRCECDR